MKATNTAIYNPQHRPHGLQAWIHSGPDDIKYKAVLQVFMDYSTYDMAAKLIYDCTTNPCEGVNSMTWDKMGKTHFAPTSASSHMRMAQLHKQDGQGAAILKVMKTMGVASSSPENKKKLIEMDKARRK
jgi:hypothetical protein